jgi:hypothetical protein
MKLYIVFFAFILSGSTLFLSCTSGECATKSSYLDAFEYFIKDIEKNRGKFSEKDWEKAEEKYNRLTGECYDKFQSELTMIEEGKIMKYSLKYAFYKLNKELSLGLTEEKIKSFQFDMENYFESGKGYKDSLSIYLKSDDFSNAMQEFSKGLDQLGKGLDDLGKGLKKMFEDINNQ